MINREYRDTIELSEDIISHYGMKNIAFYDIETTGFDKEENKIILISLGYFLNSENFIIKQYFAENLEQEKQILQAFSKDLRCFERWSSFNGIAFDEPFLIKRMEANRIKFTAPADHIDIYRLIRPYYKQLGMERCNLKSIERHIGIEREDQIDGGISVLLYFQYLQNQESSIKDVIMLHNYEDVLNLPKLFGIIFEVDTNCELQREDCLTEKQLRYIKLLLSKNRLSIDINYDKISRKTASKIIDVLLKPRTDIETIKDIINSSY
jgi:uncharacterized protein